MPIVNIQVGQFRFAAAFETELAPVTCARFAELLPFEEQLVQARWSGEAGWIPLGDRRFDLPNENMTSYPAPGQLLFYPGGYSETELLFAYGATRFASKLGQLAGNHFLTLTDGHALLPALGRHLLRIGALEIRIVLADKSIES